MTYKIVFLDAQTAAAVSNNSILPIYGSGLDGFSTIDEAIQGNIEEYEKRYEHAISLINITEKDKTKLWNAINLACSYGNQLRQIRQVALNKKFWS